MASGYQTLKYIILVNNATFLVCGIIMCFGVVYCYNGYADFSECFHVSDTEIFRILTAFAILVFTFFLIAVFGALTMGSERKCWKKIYRNMAFLTFWFNTILLVMSMSYEEEIYEYFKTNLANSIGNYTQPKVKILWKDFQLEFKCCGLNGFTDWSGQNNVISDGCCKDFKIDCASGILPVANAPNLEKIYTKGCIPTLMDTQYINLLKTPAFITVLNLIVAWLCSHRLASLIKHNKHINTNTE